MREVKVSVAASAIDSFVPCLAHGLDHFRADFEHVIAPLGDGGFEMRSFGPDKALLMVNRLRRVDREVTVATRVHADAPPLEKWYAGVDEGIDECKQ